MELLTPGADTVTDLNPSTITLLGGLSWSGMHAQAQLTIMDRHFGCGS
jgi:hypothetical protein